MQRCPEPWSRSFTFWLMLRHTGRNITDVSRVPALVASSRMKPHRSCSNVSLEPTKRPAMNKEASPRGDFSSTYANSERDVVYETFAPRSAEEVRLRNRLPVVEYPVNMGRPKDWPSWVLAMSAHASCSSL